MNEKIMLSHCSIEKLADILQKSGATCDCKSEITRHLQNGAPMNEDGSIDVIKFISFLKRTQNGNQ